MKSIATILINITISNSFEKELLKMRARDLAETCQTILIERHRMYENGVESKNELIGGCNCDDSSFTDNLIEWCESELKILKDGGLI